MCLLGTTVPQLHLIGNAGFSSSQYIRVDIQKSNMDMNDLGYTLSSVNGVRKLRCVLTVGLLGGLLH